MSIKKFRASRVNNTTVSSYVGQPGDIFYDEVSGKLKISDGNTVGGHYIDVVVATHTQLGGIKAGPGANVSVDGTLTIDTTGIPLSIGDLYIAQANISAVNANENLNLLTNGSGDINIVGNLHVHTTAQGPDYPTPILEARNDGNVYVNGNLITNGGTYLVGTTTFIGPTVHEGNLVTNGNLITVGSSYFQGNITEIGNLIVIGNSVNSGNSIFNGLSTFNGNTVRVGDTVSTGNVTWNGTTTTNGSAINNGPTVFNGNTTFVVATQNSVEGAVEITGDASARWQTPVTTGVMLHVTGQASLPSRIYNDAMNNYALYVGRRFNGTMASPTAVLANDDISRFAGGVYTSAGWANIGPSRISFVSSENQTDTNQGGRIEFWTTANSAGPAYANIQRIASVDAAVGFQATQFTTAGNVTAGNVIATTVTATNLTANSVSLQNQITGANTNISTNTTAIATLNANVGSYHIWANVAIASIITNANANTSAYLSNGITTNIVTTGNVTAGNINVSASGTLSTPRVILNDGGIRQLTGNTAVTLDFTTDSMVSLTNPTNAVTITLANYTAGAIIRFIYSSATARTINLGVAAAVNSTTGGTTLLSTGPGAPIGNNQSVILTYYCVGGTAATTYVSASYV